MPAIGPAHSFAVPSRLAVASSRPSGDQATELTPPVCLPLSASGSRPSIVLHSLALPSALPRGEQMPVGRPRHGVDGTVISAQSKHISASGGCPELRCFVGASGRQTIAVRRPGYGIDRTGMRFRVSRSRLSTACHNFAVPSALAVARCLASGDHATDKTLLTCALKVSRSRPLDASHSTTVPSALPVATSCPSGDHFTAKTDAACPVRVSRARPLSASHTLAVPSLLPVVRSVVSGDQATKLTGPVCPLSIARSTPVEASDIRAVPSARLPSPRSGRPGTTRWN